jgi:hypothetical protein
MIHPAPLPISSLRTENRRASTEGSAPSASPDLLKNETPIQGSGNFARQNAMIKSLKEETHYLEQLIVVIRVGVLPHLPAVYRLRGREARRL